MSSQIYSRYVPPPKKNQNSTTSSPIPPPPTTIAPPAKAILPPTTKDASLSYARYVPPSKQKAPLVVQLQSDLDVMEQPALTPSTKRKQEVIEEDEPSSIKVKKQKKEKVAIRSNTSKSIPESESKPPNAGDSGANVEVKKTKPKSRSKSNKNVDDEEAGEAVDGEDARHSRLLEKREKSLRKAQKLAKRTADEPIPEDIAVDEPPELHDLVPLPQPEPAPGPIPQSHLTSLPPWLRDPIRVLPTTTATFSSVGVPLDVSESLEKKGFKYAFAVQAALLPYLLPGKAQQDGDFLVSAATGSGKTLSYILPMVEDISRNVVTKLRGLIVLPTRELVGQAKEVSEMCASIYSGRRRLRIGTAVGNETFKAEQASLMEQELVYDPSSYKKQLERLNKKWENSEDGSDGDLCDDEVVADLVDHVINPIFKVDVLICTPGRLVEHLRSTPGFTLKDVQWLVVDEADKLLDQSFQEWLDVVMVSLQKPRKIILSATITRDVGKLNGLKLSRPHLVVVEEQQDSLSEALFLPATLKECAIKVVEEGIKPLYLMEILKRAGLANKDTNESAESSEDSSSASSSSSSSASSSSSSDEDFEDESKKEQTHTPISVAETSHHGALIFTKSNESAVRLGRLLALLKPSFTNTIGILTSTTRSSDRKSALRSFEAGKLSILVASDLVARGLDLTNLANVINYDIPTSLTSYVHRVGRTARAGKGGFAWTLHSSSEARWFWNEIGKTEAIRRAEKVERVKFDTEAFDRDGYEKALEVLEKESNRR